jgi:heat shock protein HslJ
MKKILFITIMAGIIAGSWFCGSPSKTTKSTMTTDSHNSQNSLDWDGIYGGTLPCADCEGIQKTIYLNKDLTYKLKIKYLGKQDSATEYTGKFTWNSQGNTITFNDEGGQTSSYFVGENALTELDKDGNKMAGELANKYILTKEKYAILEKYWKLVELNGKPVIVDSSFRKEPHIIFKDEGSRFVGNGGCNGFSGTYQLGNMNKIELSQAISTLMACPASEIESQFLKTLAMADNYTINGDMLVLNKARMAPLARFKIVYLK